MTNEEWFEILEEVAQIIREAGLGLGRISLMDKWISVPLSGVIGGMKGQKGLHNAARAQPSTKDVEVRRVYMNRRPTGVDVKITEDISEPLTLDSFERLAAYLLLHETGHLKYGHLGMSTEDLRQEREANDFAADWIAKLGF